MSLHTTLILLLAAGVTTPVAIAVFPGPWSPWAAGLFGALVAGALLTHRED